MYGVSASILFTLGKDYIRFINLNEMDEAPLQFVEPDSVGLETGDYFSKPIYVNQGIPIGARPSLTTVLYVSQHKDMKTCRILCYNCNIVLQHCTYNCTPSPLTPDLPFFLFLFSSHVSLTFLSPSSCISSFLLSCPLTPPSSPPCSTIHPLPPPILYLLTPPFPQEERGLSGYGRRGEWEG